MKINSLITALLFFAVLSACVPNFDPADLFDSGIAPELPRENIDVTVDGVTFKMIYVKGSTFKMGATSEQYSDSYTDELPVHNVTLSDYYIGETEVTQALWEAVMGTNPGNESNARYAVNNVSWYDCQLFVRKLREKTGYDFALPTEAQWEYAARGGTQTSGYKYPGSNYLDDVAWYESNSSNTSHLPASKYPNELGIYDMAGNMGEWCYDRYADYYPSEAQINPLGVDTGSYCIYRGGTYTYEAATCRNSYRDGALPGERYGNMGLRLCISAHNPVPDVPESDDTTVDDGNVVTVTDNLIHINGVEYKMFMVEGGIFTMNHPYMVVSTGPAASKPPTSQTVTLSNYRLGQTEVTQALWEAVMKYEGVSKDGRSTITPMQDIWLGGEPTKENGLGGEFPVYNVSYNDIVELFLPRLNAITGRTYALPTEAQWEFAARGGGHTLDYTFSGSNTADYVAWYAGNSGSMTHVVLSKEPNELGFHDMSGNVSEWCSDWYGYYTGTEVTNPAGTRTGITRVYRGGSYASTVSTGIVVAMPSDYELAPETRMGAEPDTRDLTRGFRIVEATAENNYPPLPNRDFTVSGVTFTMIPVEGGTFTMGATSEQGSDVYSDEKPAHQVTLSDYYIGETEVTQALWEAVMTYSGTTATGATILAYSSTWLGTSPSSGYGLGDNYPAYHVSYTDIVDLFLPRLNSITGQTFRLPTEAEWEYAARGGNKSKGYKYAGGNTIGDVAWCISNSNSTTHPVKSKQPNELGLYDMSGNVWEWCSDWYGSYSSTSQTNPTGPATGSYRVLRGGSWGGDAGGCRVSGRDYGTPGYGSYYSGLRLVLSVQK